MEHLAAALLRAGKVRFARAAEAKLAGDDFLGEVAFADEQRDHEHPRGEDAAQGLPKVGFLLPEGLAHLREEAAPAQFVGVQPCRRGGVGVDGRTVAYQHQRGV